MFCSKCGAEVPEESKFCNKCGGNFKTGFQISNGAMLVAAVAAVIALGAAFLPSFGSKTDSRSNDAEIIETPAPVRSYEPSEKPKQVVEKVEKPKAIIQQAAPAATT